MKAAIYCRYSSDRQSELSLDAQIAGCRRELQARGWQEAAVYSDSEIPGTITLRRRGYQDMLAAAKRGEFGIIVVDELSRLSRRVSEQAGLMERLPVWGVHLRAISNGIDTLAAPEAADALVMMGGFSAATETRMLAHRTRSRMREHVQQGHHVGGLSYGYRSRAVHADRAGDPPGTGPVISYELVIHEGEAAVVRRIFGLYAGGQSARQIAALLNREGIPAPAQRWRGRAGVRRTWCMTTIAGDRRRGSGILNNERYAGRVVWNRRTWLRDSERDGRRVWRDMPESEWVVLEAPDLRIVSEELWRAVKARQQRTGRQDLCTAEGQRNRRLLSGILKCGNCGANMVLSGKDTYVCAARQQRGEAVCNSHLTVSASTAEAAVLHELDELASHPRTVRHLGQRLRGHPRRERRQAQEAEALREQLEGVNAEIAALVDAVAQGTPLGEDLLGRMRQAETRRDQLQAAIRQAEAQPPSGARIGMLLRRVVKDLRAQLAAGRIREVKAAMTWLVKSIEARPRLVPGYARPAATLVLHGPLEGILELAKVKNASSGGRI